MYGRDYTNTNSGRILATPMQMVSCVYAIIMLYWGSPLLEASTVHVYVYCST